MDLNVFFTDVGRIATALELIADRMKPPVTTVSWPSPISPDPEAAEKVSKQVTRYLRDLRVRGPLYDTPCAEPAPVIHRLDFTLADPKYRDALAGVLTKPAADAPPVAEVSTDQRSVEAKKEDLEKRVIGLLREGFYGSSIISKRLNEDGVKTPYGFTFTPGTVSRILVKAGLPTTRDACASMFGGEMPTATLVPEVAQSKPDQELPSPALARTPARTTDRVVKMSGTVPPVVGEPEPPLFDMLSPDTRARAIAFRKSQPANKADLVASSRDLIDAAIAAGKVTRCDPCVDSTGFDHINAKQVTK